MTYDLFSARLSSIPWLRARFYAAEIASAIGYLHSLQIIYRFVGNYWYVLLKKTTLVLIISCYSGKQAHASLSKGQW